jgi:hypothetical protein
MPVVEAVQAVYGVERCKLNQASMLSQSAAVEPQTPAEEIHLSTT